MGENPAIRKKWRIGREIEAVVCMVFYTRKAVRMERLLFRDKRKVGGVGQVGNSGKDGFMLWYLINGEKGVKIELSYGSVITVNGETLRRDEPTERRTMESLEKLHRLVALLRKAVKEDLKIQQLVLLLKIGAEYPEPVTYAELAKDADIAVASVSRNIKILGEKMIQDSKGNWINVGLGFVTARPNPYNSREYVAELTKKGKALMAKVNSAMLI